MVPDSTLGLRPNIDSAAYDANGILRTSIHSKADNPYKILFIGNSVTARGHFVRALAAALKSDANSYLNGGVEAYNIQQEVEFFFRYQAGIRPDAIVHILHVNDLRSTRLAYRNRDGTLLIHAPRSNPQNVNAWLYQHSQLYQFVISRLHRGASQDDLRSAAVASLRKLRDYTREQGIAYHVILFPLLPPPTDWPAYDRLSYDHLLSMSRELELGTVDLHPLASRLHAQGVPVQDRPGDTWHPNQRFAEEAFSYILERLPALASRRKSANENDPRRGRDRVVHRSAYSAASVITMRTRSAVSWRRASP